MALHFSFEVGSKLLHGSECCVMQNLLKLQWSSLFKLTLHFPMEQKSSKQIILY